METDDLGKTDDKSKRKDKGKRQMSEMDFIRNEERAAEKTILLGSTLVVFFLWIDAESLGQLGENILWTLPELVIGWCVYIKQYGRREKRAYVMTALVMVPFLYFGAGAENMTVLVSAFGAVAALIALYSMPGLIYAVTGVGVGLLLYHGLVRRSVVDMRNEHQRAEVFLLLVIFLAMGYFISYLVKKSLRLNGKLLEAIKTLHETEHSKEAFMANVSHEIRTPLNTVCGMSEILSNEVLTDTAKEAVYDIQTAGRNLQTIVSDIIDFSELETGKTALHEGEYNFTSIINDVLNMAVAQNVEKKLELIVDCDTNIPCGMIGDADKIRRILSCLVSNAIKFTEEGAVSIRALVRNEEYGVNLCITVSDTGIGMSPEQVEGLFGSFPGAASGKNKKQGGIGIGLAITEKLVAAMQGFLSVKSEPGQGSEFQVVIPQKVVDSRPVVSLKERTGIRILGYIDQEKYKIHKIRKGYIEMFKHMSRQLEVPLSFCRNLLDLKRQIEKGGCSHLFISAEEYREEPEYFEKLSGKMQVLLITDRSVELGEGPDFLRIYKPFYAPAIAAVLNGEYETPEKERVFHRRLRFVAPEAEILVVDDNAMNLKVMEGLLRPYQVRFYTAESGQEALEMFEQHNFDLIFMDHMMPEMDGIETLRLMKEKLGSYFDMVPVVALTANAIGGAREMFLAEGFRDFLAKPVEVSCLEQILKAYLAPTKILEQERHREQKQERLIEEETGLLYCGGNRQDYQDVLKVYYDYGKTAVQELEQFFAEKNWKEYTIRVHSLKSASLGIGAVSLFELAKAQEAAAREEEEAELLKRHDEMMEKYGNVLEEIAGRLQEDLR